MWHKRFNLLHFVRKKLTVIFTFHNTQHFVGSRLKRNMEVRHNMTTVHYKFNNFVGQQVWLNGGNTETHICFNPVECFYQVEEGFISMRTKVANIHTCKYYFLSSCFNGFHCLLNSFSNRSATTTATRKRYSAISTVIIATILHFQKVTGTVVARTRRTKLFYFIYFCGMNFTFGMLPIKIS